MLLLLLLLNITVHICVYLSATVHVTAIVGVGVIVNVHVVVITDVDVIVHVIVFLLMLLYNTEVLKTIHTQCENYLPSYARPVFIRFMTELHLTGTFKHQKVSSTYRLTIYTHRR